MDAFAHGLLAAERLLETGALEEFVAERYNSYRTGIGEQIVQGKVGFEELSAYALEHDRISLGSGRQELLETILNRCILEV